MRRYSFLALVLSFVLAACSGGTDLGPPSGWMSDGADRWWLEGTDTEVAFRNLETLEDMGVTVYEDIDMGASVQNRIIELYRANPEIVDSLFAVHGVPAVEAGAPDAGDRTAQREEMVQALNREMARHFRQPLVNGDVDAGIVFPDSLRQMGVSGQVVMQVYVDDQGAPQAIELIEGTHPSLDALSMQAATRMRWYRSWVITDGEERYIPGWTRVTLRY